LGFFRIFGEFFGIFENFWGFLGVLMKFSDCFGVVGGNYGI
jgi:hypothetical protein